MSQRSPRQPDRATPPRSNRFTFGLLFYSVLTVVLFDLVRRAMPRLARRVGGIENGWLQFGIYFAIYVVLMLVGWLVARRLLRRYRHETLLRLVFVAGATLSFVVAAYQNRFGTGMSATYLIVGVLGAFAGVLLVTRRVYGLVEVNSPPPPEVVATVLAAHRQIVLADTTWDHIKRAVELVLSLSLIVLSLPISVLLALIIWFQDPGPLIFAKIVVTRGGRSFPLLKLRSMIKDAEHVTGAVPAAPGDARVTAFGQMLRKTHIDELPQMINIAWGHMSLVGPRPERTIFVYRHLRTLPRYPLRHAVRPGLAGLAALHGDYYSTPREKLRYDLLYIRRRSFMLDLKLFLGASVSALVGRWPGMSRGRRLFNERRQEQRFQAAYEALHGSDSDQPAPPRRSPPQAPLTTTVDRLRDADERTPVS